MRHVEAEDMKKEMEEQRQKKGEERQEINSGVSSCSFPRSIGSSPSYKNIQGRSGVSATSEGDAHREAAEGPIHRVPHEPLPALHRCDQEGRRQQVSVRHIRRVWTNVIGEIFLLQGRAVLFPREREPAQLLRHPGRPSDGARRDQGGADEERRLGAAASLRGLGRVLGQAGVRGAKTAGTRFNSFISIH